MGTITGVVLIAGFFLIVLFLKKPVSGMKICYDMKPHVQIEETILFNFNFQKGF